MPEIELGIVYFGIMSSLQFSEDYLSICTNNNVNEDYEFFHMNDPECA